jgi:hypothetical protein
MTIVGRGLGRGGSGILVAFGLGRDLSTLEQIIEIIVQSSIEELDVCDISAQSLIRKIENNQVRIGSRA